MELLNRNLLIISILTLFKVAAAINTPLAGQRASCFNEGERVLLDDIDKNRCYSCICKNGFVECLPGCPRIDDCHFMLDTNRDKCNCKRCKGCIYEGVYHPSHTEWTSPKNPCQVLRCEAGIVTESDLHCHTPCANPLPPEPGKCCPTCPECKINGQIASEDRDVISDDPCLKCRCSQGKMTCSKQACPVLQCTPSWQYHPPGECCLRCKGTKELISTKGTCPFQTSLYREGDVFNIDKCTTCICSHETSICTRDSCPILDCSPELQKPVPGSCCKKCIMPEESRTQCFINGVLYEDGQQWKLDSCKSCKCQRGMPSCAMTRCNTTCAAGTRLVNFTGECCPKCVEVDGACMVFGDPHYKSFDGKIFSFKGVGKYQLAADCQNHTFSVKVANTYKAFSSSTKRVAVQYGNVRLNLQQKKRIKYNGQRIKPPYSNDRFQVVKLRDGIEVSLHNGVKLLWNGRSFLEITVPAAFKNKLCGLCGNFNSNVQDDLRTRGGRVVTDKEILSFGTSWCSGKRSDCAKKIKTNKNAVCPSKHRSEKNVCFKFFNSETFTACESKLNYSKYYKACKLDMCNCPGGRCYCESLMAYARECQRLGVKLPNWHKHSYCDGSSSTKPNSSSKPRKDNPLLRFIPKTFNKTRGPVAPIPIQ